MTDIRQIERMTPYEFEIRMTAYQLKRLDEQETIHHQAWVNWQVQSTKKEGKKTVPVFTSFKKFFDKEKLENEILGKKEETPRIVNS